jgi:lactose/cellobiose-specific phosphotransferase system IIC component
MPMAVSIRKGLTYMIPLLLIGSFALMILSLPVPAYQDFMKSAFGESWGSILLFIRDGTFNILSLLMVICISYSYINELDQDICRVSPIIGVCVSLSSYIAVSGISSDTFSISNFAATGIFIAIAVSSSSSYLFVRLSAVKFLKVRAYTNGANAAFSYALASIFPATITVAVFAGLNTFLVVAFHITNIQLFIQESFSNIFLDIHSEFLSGILFILMVHILWFFGIHGSNVLEPVTQSIFTPGTEVNHVMLLSGFQPDIIFTKTFFDSFVLLGGCGASLCLVTALLFVGKYKNHKGLARLSFLPLLFNINELIVFGLPIVLNPVFLIPFIGIPILLTIISYFAMVSGLVPLTSNTVEWTTPILLSGYVATGSIAGSLLQLFNFSLGVLIYAPFVRLLESLSKAQFNDNLERVYDAYKQTEERGYPPSLLSRHDEIGNIAKYLAVELADDLHNGKINLYYQPQMDYHGNTFGIEALLRWKHETYGFIYPPLVIALADESHLIDTLGYWIFEKSCSDLAELRKSGLSDISLAVNVSAVQLENDDLIPQLKDILKRYEIPSHLLKIEITEQIALAGSQKIISQIDAIREMGVKLAMDDFGMGHSSLKYLKEYDFDTIKLDGSLVREVAANSNCRNIISSIVYLSKSLNCTVIAEYVEDEHQRAALYELGCEQYQGYLYSKPLPYEDLVGYLTD